MTPFYASPPDLTGYAKATDVPVATTSTPTGVADTSQQGSNPKMFEPAGHVHASRRRKRRVTGVNTASYAWTFPTPFATGTVPVCAAIVEDPANSATDSYNVQVVGVPTNTGCTFRIIRTSLLLGILGLNATAGTVNLHCTADEP